MSHARNQPTRRRVSTSPTKQLAGFIAKFDSTNARLIRACRTEMRRLLPAANELVYDNYNFFVIGYATTERASDCILSLAAGAGGIILSFFHGARLPDPRHLLLGDGKQNRFIRLPDAGRSVHPECSRSSRRLLRRPDRRCLQPVAV